MTRGAHDERHGPSGAAQPRMKHTRWTVTDRRHARRHRIDKATETSNRARFDPRARRQS
jgi:hypothetical protein